MSANAAKEPRADHDLGFLLSYENVAWFDDGRVRILDRRLYPTQVSYLVCQTVDQVADAIAAMVTQSAGPYTAAGMGMALAAYQVRGQSALKQKQFLIRAAERLACARPTTAQRMRRITGAGLRLADQALADGQGDLSRLLFDLALASLEQRYRRMTKVGEELISLLPDKASVLTHCFGETIVGTMLRAAKARQMAIDLFVTETRPYFQGSRLTASVAAEMSIPVTVITDNMPAALMSSRKIDLFTTAADLISREGFVVNKTGTLQIAITARYFDVPYYVTGIPDPVSIQEVTLETRDPREVLEAWGVRNTKPGVEGYYPAFDVTPPDLVRGVVTDTGILSPSELDRYRSPDGTDFYAGTEP